MRARMRRRWLLGSVVSTILLAACAGGEPTGESAPVEADTEPSADRNDAEAAAWEVPDTPITLNLWDSAEQTKADLYADTLIPQYVEKHPNVTINYESISTADMLERLLVALSTGTGPELFVLTDWFMPVYMSQGLLDPVPPEAFGYASLEEMEEAYLEGRLEAFKHEGNLYAIPYQMNSYSLYINNRLFEEAGLDPDVDAPQTWQDVAKLNEVLTKEEGGRIIQKGYEMRYAGDHWLSPFFHNMVYQAGGDVLDESGRAVFNSLEGVRAMEEWKAVTVAPTVTNQSAASPYQDFADELQVMMFAPPNAGAFIEQLNPEMADNYTVKPQPQIDPDNPVTVLYSFNLVVNAAASEDEKKAAWDFIADVTGQPQLWMERTRMINPLDGWFETPEAQAVPGIDVFVNEMALGRPMARTVHFQELQSSISRAIERIVLDGVDIQASLDQAVEEYERAAQGQ